MNAVFLWFYVLPIIGVLMLVLTPIFFFLLWFKILHPTARKLNRFIRKKIPIAAITYDTGKTVLTGIVEKRGEGVVKTTDGLYRILPRSPWGRANPPEYSDLVLKRSYLEKTNVPFFIGYSGKVCLMNPDMLAVAEMAERNPQKKIKKKKAREEEKLLLLLDSRKIKQWIERSYSESQLLAVIRDTEEVMRASMGFSKFVFPLITFMIAMFVIAIIMKIMGLI